MAEHAHLKTAETEDKKYQILVWWPIHVCPKQRILPIRLSYLFMPVLALVGQYFSNNCTITFTKLVISSPAGTYPTQPIIITSWLLKEAKFGRLPLLETTVSSLSSARCAPFWGKISGGTGQFEWRDWNLSPDVIDSFTWRYWTVSPDVTWPYHLTLLDSFTWRYWTASPDVTGQFHLALPDRITWRYWAVSLVMTEPIGQFHLALVKPITWPYRIAIELFIMQRPTL